MSYLINPNVLRFESGDRMSREEFLTRWDNMPGLKNAELIEGVVYMPSPLSLLHSHFEGRADLLLSFYSLQTPGCGFLPNATWMMMESAPQPDTALRILPEYGGRSSQGDKFAAGAPELVIEISASSRSYDLGPKLALYQRAEVQEYIVALLEESRLEYRVLESGSYRVIAPEAENIYKSRVFPGLWINASAFWQENAAGLFATLQQGLASEEHQKFVENLERQRTR